MKETTVTEKEIAGLSVRTKNEREMNPDTAKLPGLWGKFYQEGLKGSPVYGVYHDYESDVNGEYTLLAGVEADGAGQAESKVKIESGKYLVFEGRGEMPQAVINTWKEIWNYFSSPDARERAYLTDFELYKDPNEVDIYVGVK